jgi:hypothetical protein
MQAQDYFLDKKTGKPIEKGIKYHLTTKKDSLAHIVEDSLKHELGKVSIKVDDLSEYMQLTGLELGFYDGTIYINNNEEYVEEEEETGEEGVISNKIERPSFLVYSFTNTSNKTKRKVGLNTYTLTNRSLDGTTLHEILHQYIEERKPELSIPTNELIISYHQKQEQTPLKLIEDYLFIEEGICEYFSWIHGEVIAPKKGNKPQLEDFTNPSKTYEMGYDLARRIVEPIIKKHGLKKGIDLLLLAEYQKPLTLEEIFNSDKKIFDPAPYYERVEKTRIQLEQH